MKQINLFRIVITLCGILFNYSLTAQNPIVPPGMYIADPEAHVWEDGSVYIYGSRDESDDYWCSHSYHVLFSDDLINWNITENAFASKGAYDQVDYCDHLLFAPDCALKDGTYYLYFCSPDRKMYTEGVATSSSPYGSFVEGKHIEGAQQIDPAVLVDDDGQAYYLWGQGKPKVAKLKYNMMELDSATIVEPLDQSMGKVFHEGTSIRKIGDLYYMVFADESRNKRPTCLGYAISDHPMGPYDYKGVIIDNKGSDPSCWNNHGSIENFNGQWYVFYHRSTNNSRKFRKVCIEPIHINEDGTIDEVEMTTQGALAKPIPATDVMQAERACFLSGKVFVKSLETTDIVNEGLVQIHPGDYVAYKYLNFGQNISGVEICTVNSRGGVIEFRIDDPDGPKIGECEIKPGKNQTAFSINTGEITGVAGKHALYLVFKGDYSAMFELDWFRFY